MKIISWNCNGAIRTKLNHILEENADVYLFQECEHPDKWYKYVSMDFSTPYFLGDNYNKGIAILVRKKYKSELIKWNELFKSNIYPDIQDTTMKYFLPIKINDKYTIINCWCHQNKSKHFAYKGQLWKYLISNSDHIDCNTIFMGDFNANVIWDDADCWWNMSNNDEILNKHSLKSAYHYKYRELLGKETRKTFYLYRHSDKSYHIDYAYVNIQNYIDFLILDRDKYLKQSDHIPILLEVL